MTGINDVGDHASMGEKMPTLTPADILALASRLPAIPQALSEALMELNRPETDIARVAALLARDQGVVLRILRVANSAFYGLSRRVASLTEATQVIGLPAVRSLVTAYAVTERFSAPANPEFDHVRSWQHSFRVAAAARQLARRLALNPETAFLAGLLHDIGLVLLGCCAPREYAAMLDHMHEHGGTLMESERATLGITHGEIGAALAEQWRFPPSIRAAILDHHAPSDGSEPTAHLVHAADVLAYVLEGSVPVAEIGSRVMPATRRLLALDDLGSPDFLEPIELQAGALMGMLEGAH